MVAGRVWLSGLLFLNSLTYSLPIAEIFNLSSPAPIWPNNAHLKLIGDDDPRMAVVGGQVFGVQLDEIAGVKGEYGPV